MTRTLVLLAAVSVLCGATLFAINGCATKPTQTQQIALDASIQAAVSIAVQNGSQDPASWASRARTIAGIVEQVRPLVSSDVVSVPQLAHEVNDLVAKAKLQPQEQVAASILIQAIARIIDANVDPNTPQAASILVVLDSVKAAASVYIPLT